MMGHTIKQALRARSYHKSSAFFPKPNIQCKLKYYMHYAPKGNSQPHNQKSTSIVTFIGFMFRSYNSFIKEIKYKSSSS